MRISALAGALALLGLAACSAGPESYASMTTGVGFGDYQRYLREREAARPVPATPYSVPPEVRNRASIVPPTAMPPAPTTLDAVPMRYAAPVQPAPQPAFSVQPEPITATPLAAPMQTTPLYAPMQATGSAAQPIRSASPATASGTRTVQAGSGFGTTPSFDPGPALRTQISNEQDFGAVSARESIESDRERLANNRAQYQVIEVATVPDASISGGPNIVAFALNTRHPVGTEVYRRINPLRWSRWENACLQFRNQDAAQEAFLADGGPTRDRGNLDPDGDGFACWWDPTPLRQAMQTN